MKVPPREELLARHRATTHAKVAHCFVLTIGIALTDYVLNGADRLRIAHYNSDYIHHPPISPHPVHKLHTGISFHQLPTVMTVTAER